MKTITYKVSIDADVKLKYKLHNVDERQFDFYVMAYLNSPDGWSQYGYFFEQSENGHITIRLSSSSTIGKLCNFSDKIPSLIEYSNLSSA